MRNKRRGCPMKRLIGLLSCALALLLSLPAIATEIPEAAKVLTLVY